jgi:predicted Zn-dependent protease with MMP-like domain
MVSDTQRDRFDQIMDEVVSELPDHILQMLDEVPVIVEDEPDLEDFEELGLDPDTTDLCGLHQGIPLTHKSVEHSGTMPDEMKLFRGGILRLCRRQGRISVTQLRRQIRITLLHEIGHHFGLTEEDLAALGYA